MADEIIPAAQPVATPTPEASAPAAAPVETVSSATAASQEVKPETTAAPIAATVLGSDEAPKPEEVPAEVKPEVAPTPPPEVKPEIKPEEKPPEEKPVEQKPEEVAPEVTSFDWKFPEGVTVDQERVSVVNKVFGEMEREGKISHEVVQKYGQQLADFHVSEVQAVAQKVAAAYDKVWKDQTKSWHDDFVKDPEIGGNRQNTTTSAARDFIRRHGGTPEQQTELRTILEKTGLGNHKALIRTFANANLVHGEPRTLKAEAPPATPKNLKQKMYGVKK